MSATRLHRLTAHLDERAIRDNVQAIRDLTATTSPAIIGVVKANAYGHGLIPAAQLLTRHGVQCLAVASACEAFKLRDGGIQAPILVTSPSPSAAMAEMAAHGIHPSISDLSAARALHQIGSRLGKQVPVHVELDTGLGRFGWSATTLRAAQIEHLAILGNLKVTGIYTHLSGTDPDTSDRQLRLFDRMYARMVAALGYRPARHVLASAGLIVGLHGRTRLEMVRPGTVLYGVKLADTTTPSPVPLYPALSLTSHIEHISHVPSGTSIGYASVHRTTAPAVMAVIPAGFADGIPRQAGGAGRVLIHDQYAPIVSLGMTNLTVDVTHIPQAVVGSAVVLLGRSGEHAIDVSEWATFGGTTPVDIATGLAPAAPRVVTPIFQAEDVIAA